MAARKLQKVKMNRVFHLQVSPAGIRLVDETPIKVLDSMTLNVDAA